MTSARGPGDERLGVDVGFIDSGGVTIHYEASGSGPALLFTHGFGATAEMFSANMAALPGYRSIAWDVRGHGASDYPEDPGEYSVDLSVADMAAILDAERVDRAVLAGHSLGGFLSLVFRARHPERVRALVLVDTGPGYRRPVPRERWNRMAEGFAADFEARGLAARSPSAESARATHRNADGLARAARGILTQHDSAVIDSLGAIDVPVLVVVGGRDDAFLGPSRYMAEKIPGARLVVIDGAGHAPNLSHADRFDHALRTFLDELEDQP